MADDIAPANVTAPMPSTSAVSVSSEALSVKVRPVAALTTAWKTTLVAGLSAVLSAALLILSFLVGVDLRALGITPERAALAGLIINVVILLLRAYGVKPIVLDDRRRDDRPDDRRDDRDRR